MWRCNFIIGSPHWLATFDMTNPSAGIVCSRVFLGDYPSSYLLRPSDVWRVVKALLK